MRSLILSMAILAGCMASIFPVSATPLEGPMSCDAQVPAVADKELVPPRPSAAQAHEVPAPDNRIAGTGQGEQIAPVGSGWG